MINGIDISAFQPGIDWPEVKKAGAAFAIIKATDGDSYVNKDFSSDFYEARLQNILRSPYHFFRPGTSPIAQAAHFLSVLNKTFGKGDLPCVLDWEVSDRLSASAQKARALAFLQAVEHETSVTPFLYSYPGFLETLGDLSEFARYPLYIAHYGVPKPIVPKPWPTYTFWQTTGRGHEAGIKTLVDLDVFNGDMDQLQKFVKV